MLRSSLLAGLRWTGAMSVARCLRRKDIIILTIHGVMKSRPGQKWRPLRKYLAPSQLEQNIRALGQSYRFVSLSETVEMLQGRRPVEPNCVAVTFDDGNRNHATEAWPILQRHGVPATFFVVSSQLGHPSPFWWDRLDYALQHLPDTCKFVSVEIGGRDQAYAVSDRSERHESRLALNAVCKSCDPSEIESVVSCVEERASSSLCDHFADDDWTASMSAADVRRLAEEGADIGSHTVDHSLLDMIDEPSARHQLEQSKRVIEGLTQRECAHVCYPSGNVNADTPELARCAGYACGVTTREGPVRPGDDLHLLPRIHVPTSRGVTELLGRLCGAADCLSWAQRLISG